MCNHAEWGNTVFKRSRKLKSLIKKGEIIFGGNRQLKIYGTLNCKSGKRMKTANRVFFGSVKEAIQKGYRPCGHCMKMDYQNWKNGLI
jgi:methylphosphotriester-DNA--protein-cysteine methyltransferase